MESRRFVPFVLIGILILTAVNAFSQGPNASRLNIETVNGRKAVAGEVIVRFRNNATAAAFSNQSTLDIESVGALGGVRQLYRFRSRSQSAASLLRALSSRPDVLYAEPNYIVKALETPNDPAFLRTWGLQNVGQFDTIQNGVPGADISATLAWNLSVGSTANVLAVVDTGVDYTHPDLAGNMWSAPSAFTVTVGGVAITCPAGSHGFNAITGSCDPLDDHGHGTHVTGTIGATGNNALGVAGVNWIASIMALKFLDSTGSGTITDAINAIEFGIQTKLAFAATNGANLRVLSNSWGGADFSQALLDEINRANTNDMLFVAAAGNGITNNDLVPTYPASFAAPNVIAVAATDNQDQLALFSNYGRASVHLGAPGARIFSTLPAGTYGYLDGTSMATPHVSGSALLLLSVCSLPTAGVKAALVGNVDLIPSLASSVVSGGRLNVNKAMHSCVDAVAVTPGAISFPDEVMEIQSPPAQATVINRSVSGLTVSSMVATGDFAVSGSNCSGVLGIGASCAISVTFTPTASGYRTGTLVITDNSQTSPHTVTLAGNGIMPLTVSPNSLTYGSQMVGTVSDFQSVTVTNNQNVAANISSITISGDFLQTNTCLPAGSPSSLAAHASCTITVESKPSVTGLRTGTLVLTADDITSPHNVQLTGTGAVLTPGNFVGTWAMNAPRWGHTATLLNNGQVLIAGGTLATPKSELYSPTTNTFSWTGSMLTSRLNHTATLLASGKVLIAGGNNTTQSFQSAELYDPSTGTFSATGSMLNARNTQTATLLPNGKVLIIGGCNGNSLSSAELYDPSTGTFSATGSMTYARCMHASALLNNGTVLVTGGQCYPSLDVACAKSAEIYDPATGTFSLAGTMVAQFGHYQFHTDTMLTTGKVLVAGGMLANPGTVELFDPSTKSFAETGSLLGGDGGYIRRATLLSDGRVLVTPGSPADWVPGCTGTCAQIYDPVSGTFGLAHPMTIWRDGHTATMLRNGNLLVTGGMGLYTSMAGAELYQPPASTQTAISYSVSAGLSATVTPSGTDAPSGSVAFFDANVLLGSATVSTPGPTTFALAPLSSGLHTFTAVYTGDATNAGSTSPVLTLTTPTISWTAPAAITYGTVLSGTQLNASASVPGTFSYTPAAGTVLGAGVQTLSMNFIPTDTTHYTSASLQASLTVNQAVPTVSLSAPGSPSFYGAPVTFTSSTTSSGSGVVTGMVTFMDGSTTLGTSYMDLSGGSTYTAYGLSVGPHSITAAYSGDTNNTANTSAAVSVTVNPADYAVSVSPASATVSRGNLATVAVTLTPQGSFSGAVNFSCTGLPSLAYCAFDSPSLFLAGNALTTNLTISTSAASSKSERATRASAVWLLLPSMLLGIVGLAAPKRSRLLAIICICVLAGSCLLQTACGGASNSGGGGGGNSGGGGTPAGNYTVTVTGAAGSIQHSTTVTLIVQ